MASSSGRASRSRQADDRRTVLHDCLYANASGAFRRKKIIGLDLERIMAIAKDEKR